MSAAASAAGRHYGRAVAGVVVVVLDGCAVEIGNLFETTSGVVLIGCGVAHFQFLLFGWVAAAALAKMIWLARAAIMARSQVHARSRSRAWLVLDRVHARSRARACSFSIVCMLVLDRVHGSFSIAYRTRSCAVSIQADQVLHTLQLSNVIPVVVSSRVMFLLDVL